MRKNLLIRILALGMLVLFVVIPFATASSGNPDFGPNVLIFDPSMSTSEIQAQVDAIAGQQVSNQFGTERYALLFKPGVLFSSNTVNSTPSNRARPPSVPTHKYPSRVCVTASTALDGKPSAVPKTSTANRPPDPAASAHPQPSTNIPAHANIPLRPDHPFRNPEPSVTQT